MKSLSKILASFSLTRLFPRDNSILYPDPSIDPVAYETSTIFACLYFITALTVLSLFIYPPAAPFTALLGFLGFLFAGKLSTRPLIRIILSLFLLLTCSILAIGLLNARSVFNFFFQSLKLL